MAMEYWKIVEAIVAGRGRRLQKYRYFEDFWKAIDEDNRLIFLKAPTGAGKTEAAITPFLSDILGGQRRWHSLLYVLPTRSLVYNMFRRICRSAEACLKESEKPVKLVISYDHGGYAPGKAYLEGDITVTTYDTLLYTFYGFRSYGHHILLSIGKLAGSLIVLDEVQLLQDSSWYSLTIMPYHILNLLRYGATVVVMTATLPKIFLEETLRTLEYAGQRVSYSIIEMDPAVDMAQRGRVRVKLIEDDLADTAAELVEKCEKPALIIVNTVERAVSVFRKLKDKGHEAAHLLHSRLIARTRKHREMIFEGGKLPKELVIVSTQVAEAGIDYDFKTLITELAPADSLIQRIGRCGRKEDGTALISVKSDSAIRVYPKVVIERTSENIDEQILEESVTNVRAASALIDSVYTMEIIEELRRSSRGEIKERVELSKSFAKIFPEVIFSKRSLYREEAKSLLRLGMELPCVLLPDRLYDRIIKLCEKDPKKNMIEVSDPEFRDLPKILEENALSLSIRPDENLRIRGIMHRIQDREFYLQVRVPTLSEEPRFWIMKREEVDINNLGKELELSDPFIINPEYYEISSDGYHLGLVKPYGENR